MRQCQLCGRKVSGEAAESQRLVLLRWTVEEAREFLESLGVEDPIAYLTDTRTVCAVHFVRALRDWKAGKKNDS